MGITLGMTNARKSYPSDVGDDEWAFCAPYLTLMREDAPQREHALRELFNGLRWFVRAGGPWRLMPHDLPPWHAVQQQTQRWLRAGCFEQMAADLRLLLRWAAGRAEAPSAAIMDRRTLQSTPESGARAGFDGHKKRKGSKVHVAVDTLGHLLALKVTAANDQERAQVADLAQAVQAATGENVQLAYVDQGCTGEQPAQDAAQHGIRLEVVKHHEAKRGFLLLPRRWVVERSFAWAARFRRLARDYERLPATQGSYRGYFHQHGRSVTDYKWSGYIFATLLPYLEEQNQIDLMHSEHDDLAGFLTQQREATHFIFTHTHRQAHLDRLDPQTFSEQQLRDYYNEFNGTDESDVGQPMLDGVRALRQCLSALDEGSVIVFSIE